MFLSSRGAGGGGVTQTGDESDGSDDDDDDDDDVPLSHPSTPNFFTLTVHARVTQRKL